jgi:exonuclease III
VILDLVDKNVQIDVLALQETWDVKYPELLTIPGFMPVMVKKRRGMRGGGVGFYVRNNLDAKILDNLSPFENKIMEAMTIQLTYPDNRCVLLTSIYRSNGNIPNVTEAQQMDRFLEKFDELCNDLRLSRKESFIFIDANIDLLNLNSNDSKNYLNLIFNHGYLQCISKASRMQNQSKSLIDHIMISSNPGEIVAGTIVCDISDHFATFICFPGAKKTKQLHKSITIRDFSQQNLNNFKLALGMSD